MIDSTIIKRIAVDSEENGSSRPFDSTIHSTATPRKPKGRCADPQMGAQHGAIGVHTPRRLLHGSGPPIGAWSGVRGVESCPSGKLTYPSPQSAWKALATQTAKRHRRAKPWNKDRAAVYHCPMCHQWHTTNTKQERAA